MGTSLEVRPAAVKSEAQPVVTFWTIDARVALLQGAALHKVDSQLSIGWIIEVLLPAATIGISEEGLRQAEASGFEATLANVCVQVLDNLFLKMSVTRIKAQREHTTEQKQRQ